MKNLLACLTFILITSSAYSAPTTTCNAGAEGRIQKDAATGDLKVCFENTNTPGTFAWEMIASTDYVQQEVAAAGGSSTGSSPIVTVLSTTTCPAGWTRTHSGHAFTIGNQTKQAEHNVLCATKGQYMGTASGVIHEVSSSVNMTCAVCVRD